MKKRLISLLLVLVLTFSFTLPVAAAEPTGKELYDRLQSAIELIRQYGLFVPEDADPLRDGLIEMFERYPETYDILMQAMFEQLDSHSTFIPAGQYDQAFPTTTSYVGVGLTLELFGNEARITAVTEGGSAQKAGILAGDIITAVDGKALAGKQLAEISALLRGKEGTRVTVTVRRGGQTSTYVLERVRIGQPNYTSHVVEDGVYYMKWSRFADTNAYLDFVFSLQDMTQAHTRSLIIDLRDNPGGSIDMAYNLLNRLIPDQVTASALSAKVNGRRTVQFVETEGMGPRLNKIIILCNGNSASASEIVQASLCDLGYAVSVGETTYGKARGQYHFQFNDGSAAVLTAIELIAPTTSDYEGIGLKPTYEVKNTAVPHPAAQCARLTGKALGFGARGEDVRALNAALAALGYLSGEVTDVYSEATGAAVTQFRRVNGLDETVRGLDAATAQKINATLVSFAGQTVVQDAQYERALELARFYAKQPIQYTVDELGNVHNMVAKQEGSNEK